MGGEGRGVGASRVRNTDHIFLQKIFIPQKGFRFELPPHPTEHSHFGQGQLCRMHYQALMIVSGTVLVCPGVDIETDIV